MSGSGVRKESFLTTMIESSLTTMVAVRQT